MVSIRYYRELENLWGDINVVAVYIQKKKKLTECEMGVLYFV